MSKELEALERLYCSGNLQLSYVLSDKHELDYEIIEQALKRLESIDNAESSEALECLEHIKKDDFNMIITTYPPLPAYNGITKDEMFNKIEQTLLKVQELENENARYKKILEILKEKNVDIELIKKSVGWLDYYTRYKHRTGYNTEIDDNEYFLLKEAFKDE